MGISEGTLDAAGLEVDGLGGPPRRILHPDLLHAGGRAKVPDLRTKHDLITLVQDTVQCYLCGKGVKIDEAWTAVHEWSDIKMFGHEMCMRDNPRRAVYLFRKGLERALGVPL